MLPKPDDSEQKAWACAELNIFSLASIFHSYVDTFLARIATMSLQPWMT
tara:strand:- start:2762 stop:2908 length:147 start_codon:yes stop_codon:yes gene_type:complete